MKHTYVILVKSEEDKKFDTVLTKNGVQLEFETFAQAMDYAKSVGLRSGFHIESM